MIFVVGPRFKSGGVITVGVATVMYEFWLKYTVKAKLWIAYSVLLVVLFEELFRFSACGFTFSVRNIGEFFPYILVDVQADSLFHFYISFMLYNYVI